VWSPRVAIPATAARWSEEHHDVVTRADGVRPAADRVYDARGLVPQDDRKRKPEISLDVVEIAVAHAGGYDPHRNLAGPWPLEVHRLDGERFSHLMQNGGAHWISPLPGPRSGLFLLPRGIPPGGEDPDIARLGNTARSLTLIHDMQVSVSEKFA
jgi:hypothetical protein